MPVNYNMTSLNFNWILIHQMQSANILV